MGKRDDVYYTLLSIDDRYLFEQITDREDYQKLGHLGIPSEYYFDANNRKFLDELLTLPSVDHVKAFLGEQLKEYVRRKPNIEGYEKDKLDYSKTYLAREKWLNYTRLLCQQAHIKTSRHVYLEVVLWCNEWLEKWLPLFDPYSPEEKKARMTFTPLWQELNEVEEQGFEINDEGLTERERALIHCYKKLSPISRGEPMYQDYMTFSRPGDRIRYPNGSKRKANSLIRSIERIQQYLTDEEKKQSENEINTIQANFHNQL